MSVASQTYTPTINIGNVASNSFGTIQQQTFEFDIVEQGNYVIALYAADVEWSDCILGQLVLAANSYVATNIEAPISTLNSQLSTGKYYTLQGLEVVNPTHGIYIRNGKKVLVR